VKLNLKPKAIKLRRKGYSINDIAKILRISESTASLWCRKIILTSKQKKNLEERTNKKLQKFFKMVEKQKQDRTKIKNKIQREAEREIGGLSKRDLFIAGIALYWAEGFKHQSEGRIGFCNSDPAMIKFMINFLVSHFKIKTGEISPRLTINESFKDREREIIEFGNRWQAAKMLNNKISYPKIKKETGLSTTTIARVSKWLNRGMNGYKLILQRLNHHNQSFRKGIGCV